MKPYLAPMEVPVRLQLQSGTEVGEKTERRTAAFAVPKKKPCVCLGDLLSFL